MQMNISSDLLSRQIESRFVVSSQKSSDHILKPSIAEDFYMDLLCVFNDPEKFKASDFKDYPLSSILLYLRSTHDLYRTKSLQEVSSAIENLSKKENYFGKLQLSLERFFSRFKSELEAHINEEEEELFPYIETLLLAKNKNQFSTATDQKATLNRFLKHHDDHLEKDLNSLVNALNKLSETYQDSFAFRMLVNRISIFELDLKIHAKIEEEVLVPKALILEERILNQGA